MEQQWIVIYKTDNEFSAEVLKQGLIEAGIPAVVLNKKISAYNIGRLEVMVSPEDVDNANQYLLTNNIQ
ncbi:putative signal transducing protein [Pedobacter flavus]|uniref:DUF2007 domain-containing protein n=1 Tax=Pedobacter flavus TaxID=3113906 RepID=A0ABU7GZP9_9SPHI|nr:DUF2007 domain-containing protein [Pedobacter sp. VNH31]MEE1884466.1 DUF2007 domain-containing protein [Pedobacter sp. VNH31]